jgi:POT family proton-dependent oligopeptide transporter
MFMGVWFLSSALGNVFGGWVGGQTEDAGFDQVFFWIAVVAAAAGGLLFVLVPLLKRMMHGVK